MATHHTPRPWGPLTGMRPILVHVSSAIVLAFLGGCMMDLPNGTVVDRPRVLGVRVEVEGDPERAEPRPGETVTLSWLLVPGGDAWTSALTACLGAPGNTGLPRCAAPPFAFALPGAPDAAPRFTFTVPAGPTGSMAGGSVVVLGVLCANGVPIAPEDGLPDCEGEGATAERVVFSFGVAGAQPANRHPSLAGQALTIDEEPWDAPPSELPATGCAASAGGPSFPRVARREDDDPSVLTFTTSPADREMYEELVLGETPVFETRRENLRVTHVATAGLFPRLFTEVFDDEAPTPEVPWRHPAPDDVPEDGLTVRFWLIVRDGRGGMDWTERAACVVP